MTSIFPFKHINKRRPIRGGGDIARPVGADRAMPGPLHVPDGETGKGFLS